MVRHLILFACIVFLLLPGLVAQEALSPSPSPFSLRLHISPAESSLRLLDAEHTERESPQRTLLLLSSHTRQMELTCTSYLSIFVRDIRSGAVSPKPPLTPQQGLTLFLANCQKDEEWFCIPTSAPLTQENSQKLWQTLRQMPAHLALADRGRNTPAIVTQVLFQRRFWAIDAAGTNLSLLADLRILHAPVWVEVWVRKNAETQFVPFSPGKDTVGESDTLQWKVNTYQKCFLVVFSRQTQGRVNLLFPVGQNSQELAENQAVFLDPPAEWAWLPAGGQEYLCCFYSTESPMDPKLLLNWLSKVKLEKYCPSRGPADAIPPHPPAPLYILGFAHQQK